MACRKHSEVAQMNECFLVILVGLALVGLILPYFDR